MATLLLSIFCSSWILAFEYCYIFSDSKIKMPDYWLFSSIYLTKHFLGVYTKHCMQLLDIHFFIQEHSHCCHYYCARSCKRISFKCIQIPFLSNKLISKSHYSWSQRLRIEFIECCSVRVITNAAASAAAAATSTITCG